MKAYALAFTILALAFLGRVGGQWMVAIYHPPFLPPMPEWYSGLLPYPALLTTQIAILLFQLVMCWQFWTGSGSLVLKRPRLGAWLKWLALVYFLAMLIRYAASMGLFPERRWLGGTIPIIFHWVLALYIYLSSRFYRGLPLGRKGVFSNVSRT